MQLNTRAIGLLAAAAATVIISWTDAASAQQPAAQPPIAAKLIPRSVLFGNPEKTNAQISPDGARLAYIAPVNGVLNVLVGPSGRISDAKPVTTDTKRGIRQYFWAQTSQHIIYLQDTDGDENWRAFSVDLATGKTLPLTPFDKIAAQVQGVSDKFPDEIVIGINNRDPQYHDLYRVNIRTAERTLLIQNDGYSGFSIDDDYKVRYAQKSLPDGGVEEFTVTKEGDKYTYKSSDKIAREDSEGTGEIGFSSNGVVRYLRDTRGRDTSAIFEIDTTTGTKKLLFENAQADAGAVIVHPRDHTIQAVEYNYEKPRWSLIDMTIEPDFQFIRKGVGVNGALSVTSRSTDDRLWVISISPDDGSPRTYLYDRGDAQVQPKVTQLFLARPALKDYSLAPMRPVQIKTRDGLTMVCYLTLPADAVMGTDKKPVQALPMVLNVHGGPWARDTWGYNSEHQWLANRGYAVLSVNYRGSTGFGKKFLNASAREWGGKMHDDLLDAVKWAVTEKIANPDKIAIYGGSYGGYAALAGMTFTPEIFACGVDIVGVSNLTTFMKTIPPYWESFREYMYKMVGDPRTEEGKKFLLERSPVAKADKITRPLLIAQGAHDPRVNKDESDQIVKAMNDKKIPVTYVVYPDEGHGFARPQNRTAFYAVAEAFLAKHLGGRVEPIGTDFNGSSITVESGAEGVNGLSEAISTKK